MPEGNSPAENSKNHKTESSSDEDDEESPPKPRHNYNKELFEYIEELEEYVFSEATRFSQSWELNKKAEALHAEVRQINEQGKLPANRHRLEQQAKLFESQVNVLKASDASKYKKVSTYMNKKPHEIGCFNKEYNGLLENKDVVYRDWLKECDEFIEYKKELLRTSKTNADMLSGACKTTVLKIFYLMSDTPLAQPQPQHQAYPMPPPIYTITSPGLVYGRHPVQTICPHCRKNITTRVEIHNDTWPYLYFAICFILGFFILITWILCFIPFCLDSCKKNAEHFCPECNKCIRKVYNF